MSKLMLTPGALEEVPFELVDYGSRVLTIEWDVNGCPLQKLGPNGKRIVSEVARVLRDEARALGPDVPPRAWRRAALGVLSHGWLLRAMYGEMTLCGDVEDAELGP